MIDCFEKKTDLKTKTDLKAKTDYDYDKYNDTDSDPDYDWGGILKTSDSSFIGSVPGRGGR